MTKEERLNEKAQEIRTILEGSNPPKTGVLVKRSVRVIRGRVVEVRQRVIIQKPQLGGGAVL